MLAEFLLKLQLAEAAQGVAKPGVIAQVADYLNQVAFNHGNNSFR